jgi:hypothetical protein
VLLLLLLLLVLFILLVAAAAAAAAAAITTWTANRFNATANVRNPSLLLVVMVVGRQQ